MSCNRTYIQIPPGFTVVKWRLVYTPPHPPFLARYKQKGHCSLHLPSGERKTCPMHERRVRTRHYCPVCNVGLCSVQCHLDWHFSTNEELVTTRKTDGHQFHYFVKALEEGNA